MKKLILFLCLCVVNLFGVDYYLDLDSTTPGFNGNVGDVTWDDSTSIWSTDSSGSSSTTPWVDGYGNSAFVPRSGNLNLFLGGPRTANVINAYSILSSGTLTISNQSLFLATSIIHSNIVNCYSVLNVISNVSVEAYNAFNMYGEVNLTTNINLISLPNNTTKRSFYFYNKISGEGGIICTNAGNIYLYGTNDFNGICEFRSTTYNSGYGPMVAVYNSKSLGTTNGYTILTNHAYLTYSAGTNYEEVVRCGGGGVYNTGCIGGSGVVTNNGKIIVDGNTVLFSGSSWYQNGDIVCTGSTFCTVGFYVGGNVYVNGVITGKINASSYGSGTTIITNNNYFNNHVGVSGKLTINEIKGRGIPQNLGTNDNSFGANWSDSNICQLKILNSCVFTNNPIIIIGNSSSYGNGLILEVPEGNIVECGSINQSGTFGTFRKKGLGKFKISGSGTYASIFCVEEGEVQVINTPANMKYCIHTNGILTGTNTTSLSVVTNSGIVYPGIDGTGTLNVTTFNAQSNSIIKFNLTDTTNNNILACTTISGSENNKVSIDVIDNGFSTASEGQVWDLMTFSSSAYFTGLPVSTNVTDYIQYSVTKTNNYVRLTKNPYWSGGPLYLDFNKTTNGFHIGYVNDLTVSLYKYSPVWNKDPSGGATYGDLIPYYNVTNIIVVKDGGRIVTGNLQDNWEFLSITTVSSNLPLISNRISFGLRSVIINNGYLNLSPDLQFTISVLTGTVQVATGTIYVGYFDGSITLETNTTLSTETSTVITNVYLNSNGGNLLLKTPVWFKKLSGYINVSCHNPEGTYAIYLNQDEDTTLSGKILENGDSFIPLIKTGSGDIVFDNFIFDNVIDSPYNEWNDGTLTFNGIGDEYCNFNINGGRLEGTGVLKGIVNVYEDAVIAPYGSGIGNLTINTLNLNGATYECTDSLSVEESTLYSSFSSDFNDIFIGTNSLYPILDYWTWGNEVSMYIDEPFPPGEYIISNTVECVFAYGNQIADNIYVGLFISDDDWFDLGEESDTSIVDLPVGSRKTITNYTTFTASTEFYLGIYTYGGGGNPEPSSYGITNCLITVSKASSGFTNDLLICTNLYTSFDSVLEYTNSMLLPGGTRMVAYSENQSQTVPFYILTNYNYFPYYDGKNIMLKLADGKGMNSRFKTRDNFLVYENGVLTNVFDLEVLNLWVAENVNPTGIVETLFINNDRTVENNIIISDYATGMGRNIWDLYRHFRLTNYFTVYGDGAGGTPKSVLQLEHNKSCIFGKGSGD